LYSLELGETVSKVLILLPSSDFDPSEVAVTWSVLDRAGHGIVFATPDALPSIGDQRMIEGGFGPFNRLLMTRPREIALYRQMLVSSAFRAPIAHAQWSTQNYQALVIPGGHAKGTRTLWESAAAQACAVDAFARGLQVAAICHGPLLLARATDPATGRSLLHGRRTTCLLKRQELAAWWLTRAWLGDYYRTYPQPLEDEVRKALMDNTHFVSGPPPLRRDDPDRPEIGFVVEDGNYLSARWPGDAWRFATTLAGRLDSAAH
jgi:protease I